jgi:GntR family transcriptional regulator
MITLRAGPIPKYYQLAEILRQQITSGLLTPGDQIPTEESLRQTHNVSRGTVREAIRLLLEEGLIRREQGRGTFVNTAYPESNLFTLTSFDEDMRRQGRQPSTQLLTVEVIPATAEVAEHLELAVEVEVIHIVRLRLADGQPVAYETRYLAKWLCPELLDEDLQNTSIHWLLIYKYEIPLVRMTHSVEIVPLTPKQIKLLQAPPDTPAFSVDRLTYTEKEGRKYPAVWFQAVYREDNYNFKARFKASL